MLNERTTVKELIAARVTSEVNSYNKKLPEYFKGLIQPTEAEKTLNGFRLKRREKKIDIEKQVWTALNAFQKIDRSFHQESYPKNLLYSLKLYRMV